MALVSCHLTSSHCRHVRIPEDGRWRFKASSWCGHEWHDIHADFHEIPSVNSHICTTAIHLQLSEGILV